MVCECNKETTSSSLDPNGAALPSPYLFLSEGLYILGFAS